MTGKAIPAGRELDLAVEALQRGDKLSARRWAQRAAARQPELEAPWLILAAVAGPRARLAYFEQALKVNPQSAAARRGLESSIRRPAEATQPVGRNPVPQQKTPARFEPLAKAGRIAFHPSARAAAAVKVSLPALALTLAICLAAAWVARPGRGAAASPGAPVAPGVQVDLERPSDTPPPSPTFTPTATSSPTPLPTVPPTSTNAPQPAATVQSAAGLLDGEYAASQLPADGPKLIHVSIGAQRLEAYQGGALVYDFIVSTGSGNSTATGTYSILDKLPSAYGADWNFWMPDWMGIYYAGDLEDGFHALPILPDGERLWGDSLGTPVSYGCIVLGDAEARLLYEWADIGTTVQIDP
ncbi:MAG TPA: L,D-transpeptidase [Anaerolineales bacterium]|nr:L,D-transpeptidase [Anaerolineales bacterium]